MTEHIVREICSPMGVEIACQFTQEGEDLGYLVLDSTFEGRASGGLRMLLDVSLEEIRLLARSMTLKYAFLGLPQGGAKAGLRFDPEAPLEERRAALRRFAQAAAPLLRARVYIPHADMGTSREDIHFLLKSLGLRPNSHDVHRSDSGHYTAHSVLACTLQAAAHLGLDIRGSLVAIEGFGHVGGALAGLFYEQGAKVVAISTSAGGIYAPQGLDIPFLLRLRGAYGSASILHYGAAERIALPDLLTLPVDILSPCARHHSIHLGNVDRIQARFICPGANNPITPEAERALSARGVLVIPDFVSNCGGVLGGTLAFAGCSQATIEAFIRREIGHRLLGILQEAKGQSLPLRDLAIARALETRQRLCQETQRHRTWQRLLSCALALYRRGWIPSALTSPFAPRYLKGKWA